MCLTDSLGGSRYCETDGRDEWTGSAILAQRVDFNRRLLRYLRCT